MMRKNSRKNCTLGDFIRYVAMVSTKEYNGFPYGDDISWHRMLLEIRNKNADLEPFNSITFVFDESAYPMCMEMNEFLDILRWTGALVTEYPVSRTVKIKPDLADIWEKELDEHSQRYREIIRESAKKLMEYTLNG
ncbi:MAG: hypothetical protein QXP38_13740 [Nitrososphaerota archaeon]